MPGSPPRPPHRHSPPPLPEGEIILQRMKEVDDRQTARLDVLQASVDQIEANSAAAGLRLQAVETGLVALQKQQSETLQELLRASREQRNIDIQQQKDLAKIERRQSMKHTGQGAAAGLSVTAVFELGKQIYEWFRHGV